MKNRLVIWKILLLNLLVLSITSGRVSSQIYFDTNSRESSLWLEGSSTVHRFDCVAQSIEGTAYIERYDGSESEALSSRDYPTRNQENGGDADNPDDEIRRELNVHLKIPIESFDCGRSRMNRDMYEALKSDEYDFITFEFEKAEPLERQMVSSDTLHANGYNPYQIEGVLNVAGVDRHITLVVQGRQEGDYRYRIRGQKKISMQNFEIDPPTALRGLIRARDDLTVFFDLLVMEKLTDS